MSLSYSALIEKDPNEGHMCAVTGASISDDITQSSAPDEADSSSAPGEQARKRPQCDNVSEGDAGGRTEKRARVGDADTVTCGAGGSGISASSAPTSPCIRVWRRGGCLSISDTIGLLDDRDMALLKRYLACVSLLRLCS